MSTETATTPAEFASIKAGDELRFSYAMKDGSTGRVGGTAAGFIGKGRDAVRVDLNPAGTDAAIMDAARATGGRVGFAAERITGLTIIPAPVQRPGYATPAQVRYALSLCRQTGNVYRPSEAEFRAMTKAQVSEWIDMAKDEI